MSRADVTEIDSATVLYKAVHPHDDISHSSVVRIYATTQDPDYDSPWQARVPSSSTGSGVVIAPNRVLTGAHVVANSTFLQVQKVSAPEKRVAHVVSICHDSDLALLEVADPEFMKDVECAVLGEIPALRDRVAVCGFPVGGEEVSITEGVVSRIEVQRYSHSQRYLLAVTVDAAINSGNSGGPVFKEGKVIGIAFQKLGDAEGIGELVPTPIVRHFLARAERGDSRVCVPGLGITTQDIENPFLREKLGLPPDNKGILLLSLQHGGSADGTLETGDVLLSIEGCPISSNSTIPLFDTHRTRYDATLGWKALGDDVHFTVKRGKEVIEVSFPLKELLPLVPRNQYDTLPTYVIWGGLVFQPLSRNFLCTWDTWWEKAPKEFLHLFYSGIRTAERTQAIVLSQVLAEQTNVGYDSMHSECVKSVNGTKIRDMKEFVALLDASTGLVEIRTSSDSVIVLSAEAARDANSRILERYHIPRDRSANL